MDSSNFCLLWFYPLFQGRFVYPAYRRFVSIVLVWIRPLLPIKLGFMAVYFVTFKFLFYIFGDSPSTVWFVAGPLNVILFEDSSSTLWIRPLLFVCCGFIHFFRADSSTPLTGDSPPLF